MLSRDTADRSPILCAEAAGATTAVYFGRASEEARAALKGFRAVLWCQGEEPEAGSALGACGVVTVVNCVSGSEAQLAAELSRFVRIDARHLPSLFINPTETEIEKRSRAPFVALVMDELREQHRARVTRQQDAFRWQQHVLANLSAYARRPLPAAWRGALAGLPAAVCGAGPSLDTSAPKLARAQAGCVVFAADSALRTLARHGVRTDFAVSIDVAKSPEKCLPESGELPGHVVLSAVSPPAWAQRMPGERLAFAASRQLTTDWLAQGGVAAPGLAVAENCGVTALALARWLGCSPIYLFGLDLALSGKQRHTEAVDGSIYVRSGFDAAQEFPEVPGNWSERVPTHARGDWRALNARLATFAPGTVLNVNDRGARLQNAPAVLPEEWIAPLACAKPARLAALAPVAAPEIPALATRLAELQSCGRRVRAGMPELRAVLMQRGPAGVAAALRPLLADAVLGRALGGFSLKLMPHLLPPAEGDSDFWRGLIDELEVLAASLESVA